jgi:hypothetical protein
MTYTVKESNGEMEILITTPIWREAKRYQKGLKKVFKALNKMDR